MFNFKINFNLRKVQLTQRHTNAKELLRDIKRSRGVKGQIKDKQYFVYKLLTCFKLKISFSLFFYTKKKQSIKIFYLKI